MRKMVSAAALFVLPLFTVNMASFAAETKAKAPRVVYIAPDNDTTIDLAGKKVLRFEWDSMPIPAGGRESYKITIYKGFSYEVVFSQVLNRDTFWIDIPAEKFYDGATYSWHVKQRDGQNMQWSRFDTWSFKVMKK